MAVSAASDSTISSENGRRMPYRMGIQVGSVIENAKNNPTFHSPEKIECSAPWLGHMHKTESHVTLQRALHRPGYIVSSYPALFPVFQCYTLKNGKRATLKKLGIGLVSQASPFYKKIKKGSGERSYFHLSQWNVNSIIKM